MKQLLSAQKKPSARTTESLDQKLLVSRQEAALRLSISERAVDYLIANKQIATRRIGSRVLIAVTELQRFSRSDHPESVAS
jgi:excisionase family DNA binding protein